MKRAIVIQADYRFMSAVVDKRTAQALREGDRIRVTQALDLDYHGSIPAGETGTIRYVDDAQGSIEIELDRVHEALHEWRNCLILVPFDTDDWITGLELVSCVPSKEAVAA